MVPANFSRRPPLKENQLGRGFEHNFYCSTLVIKVSCSRDLLLSTLDNYNRKWLLLPASLTHHSSKNWKTNPSCGELFLSPLESQVQWNLSIVAVHREPCKGDVLSQMSRRVIKIFRISTPSLCVDIKATAEAGRRRWGNWCDEARHMRHWEMEQTIDNERIVHISPSSLPPAYWERCHTEGGDLMEMYSGYSPLMGRGIFQYLCKLFLQFLSQTWIQTCFRYAKYSFNDIPSRFQELKPEHSKCGLRTIK